MSVVIKEVTNIPAIIDELIYRNYRYNRLRSPDISPEKYRLVFANADAMEQRFQREASK
jgi:hypothetical protein